MKQNATTILSAGNTKSSSVQKTNTPLTNKNVTTNSTTAAANTMPSTSPVTPTSIKSTVSGKSTTGLNGTGKPSTVTNSKMDLNLSTSVTALNQSMFSTNKATSSGNLDQTTDGSKPASKGTTTTSKNEPGTTEKSTSFDRDLAIIFGSACGLMLIVIIALCISRKRHIEKQEQFMMGGHDIEITSSKF
jgi:hypothetical protein